MINLQSYIVLKEELDAENLQWKYNNWSSKLSDENKSILKQFRSDSKNCKDIKSFKNLVDNSGINFDALTNVMNDESQGMPDNYDNIYILKKIIDTINTLNKGKND